MQLFCRGHSRIMLMKSGADRSPIRVSQGVYVCLFCGEIIRNSVRRGVRLFCCNDHRKRFEVNTGCVVTWNDFRYSVLERDGEKCRMCGKDIFYEYTSEAGFRRYNTSFVCDHIVPLFKGGRDWYDDPAGVNFQTLCVECNKVKTRLDRVVVKTVPLRVDRDLTSFLCVEGSV